MKDLMSELGVAAAILALVLVYTRVMDSVTRCRVAKRFCHRERMDPGLWFGRNFPELPQGDFDAALGLGREVASTLGVDATQLQRGDSLRPGGILFAWGCCDLNELVNAITDYARSIGIVDLELDPSWETFGHVVVGVLAQRPGM